MKTVPAHLKHRTAQATITLTAEGKPLAHQAVNVAQTRHRFLFGSNWGSSIALVNGELHGRAKEQAERREALFLDLFNFATLPFYWGRFEPVRGRPETASTRKAAEHYRLHGCKVKGHPLCWHTVCADWLLPLSNTEIIDAQMARIRREAGGFKGLVDMWDVVNEAVIMPVFDKYDNGITRICQELGSLELIRQTFQAARETDPTATLVLNDFDTSPAYAELIERCLDAGIQIDALGIQSHMHQGWWGLEKTQQVLERFERFGLPLQFTEITLVSGELMPAHIVDLNDFQVDEWPTTPAGEARQSEESAAFYQALFAHPLVSAITWWDMSDGSWLHAPAGLLRQDQSPKPAYESLHRLIKGEWWLPPTEMTTDANGCIRFDGYLGDYELGHAGRQKAFSLEKNGEVTLTVPL
ncbi:MAG: endo-1,4-beta-xylanase [Chloroflexota bacterium]